MKKSIEAMEQARDVLNQRLGEVAQDAREAINEFWREREINKGAEPRGEKPPLGCRLIERASAGGMSYRIVWYSNRFFKANQEKWRVQSTEIKPTKTGEYNITELLRKSPAWSHELVENLESTLSKLRVQIQLLGYQRKYLSMAITEAKKKISTD